VTGGLRWQVRVTRLDKLDGWLFTDHTEADAFLGDDVVAWCGRPPALFREIASDFGCASMTRWLTYCRASMRAGISWEQASEVMALLGEA